MELGAQPQKCLHDCCVYTVLQMSKMKTREKYIACLLSLIVGSCVIYLISNYSHETYQGAILHQSDRRRVEKTINKSDLAILPADATPPREAESHAKKNSAIRNKSPVATYQNQRVTTTQKKPAQEHKTMYKSKESRAKASTLKPPTKETKDPKHIKLDGAHPTRTTTTVNYLKMSKHVISPHNFNYIINNPHMCTVNNVTVIVVVHTATYNFQKRDDIRKTWASVYSYNGMNYRTAFMIAKTLNKTIQDKIVQEDNQHHDIIQEDFIDHYRNMTYKHLMGYKWINTFCNKVKYVVKVDDDVLIDIYHLTNFLKQKMKENVVKKLIYGRLFKANVPHRFPGSKWYMPRQLYPEDKYPDYCEGFAYITTPDVTQSLFKISLYFPYLWVDDVHVLGILRRQTDIKITSFSEPNGSTQMTEVFSPSRIKKVIFLLARWDHQKKFWFDNWKVAVKVSKAA